MGAVCYKPKASTISKDDVLRVLNDKYIRESITEPSEAKTMKTDEQHNQMLTFGNLTQQLQIDTHEIQNTNPVSARGNKNRASNLNANKSTFGQIELNILTYYGYKEDIYDTLTMMSRKSLYFMKKNYHRIEVNPNLQHANERVKLVQMKSIEEHSSGVNQLLRINQKELVTVSDDCYLKFWQASNMKVDGSLATETITCIAITGHKNRDILVAGCHSGNLLMISSQTKQKKEQVTSAHYNLIRVIVSLEALKHKYFVTADVCGIVKVWTSSFKTQSIMELDLEQAISYNSMIEVQDMLPRRSSYEDTAMIACALKSQKINLILLIPGAGTYQIIKSLKTTLKPTCLIQLSSKHLAIAVGSLKEESQIEIHDMNKNKIVSKLSHHKDMIDSLLKITLPNQKLKTNNQYVTWLLSASRDRQIVLWKLIDGKMMRRNYNNLVQSFKKPTTINPSQSLSLQNKKSTIEQDQSMKKREEKKKQEQKRKRRSSQDDDDFDESQDVDDDEIGDPIMDDEEEKQPELPDITLNEQGKGQSVRMNPDLTNGNNNAKMLDYYFVIDSGHKDFIRSMVQMNDNTVITASEDKTIKIFSIGF